MIGGTGELDQDRSARLYVVCNTDNRLWLRRHVDRCRHRPEVASTACVRPVRSQTHRRPSREPCSSLPCSSTILRNSFNPLILRACADRYFDIGGAVSPNLSDPGEAGVGAAVRVTSSAVGADSVPPRCSEPGGISGRLFKASFGGRNLATLSARRRDGKRIGLSVEFACTNDLVNIDTEQLGRC
jgi:hypothetical protein